MYPVKSVTDLESQLSTAHAEAERFFRECESAQENKYDFELSAALAAKARDISSQFDAALVRIAALVQHSPMFGSVDLQAIQLAVRRINAALRLRLFEEWGTDVLHDEGRVLGVKPAGSSENRRLFPHEALVEVNDALDQVSRRMGVLRAQAEAEAVGEAIPSWLPTLAVAGGMRVQPGTAFIMMMIDPNKPDLEDVKRTIQEEFARFGIKAIRADDIEHSGEITQRILEEIKSSEFLIADLTGERPSVYYEIGFAHAIGKRPILYRRAGTRLHFDLTVHNCPEYVNLTDLREKLNKRLKAITRGE
jgi:hypothetical protein